MNYNVYKGEAYLNQYLEQYSQSRLKIVSVGVKYQDDAQGSENELSDKQEGQDAEPHLFFDLSNPRNRQLIALIVVNTIRPRGGIRFCDSCDTLASSENVALSVGAS